MHRQASDTDSFASAQRKARKWADRGIDLSGAGEARRARLAAMNAEFWVERMLSIESRLQTKSARDVLHDRRAGTMLLGWKRPHP